MASHNIIIYCAVMAIVTYIIRMLPLVLINKKLENQFIKSFLYYIPYCVLAAMVIPEIFFVTGSYWSAFTGFIVAIIMSYRGRSLITVAICTCLCVFAVDSVVNII